MHVYLGSSSLLSLRRGLLLLLLLVPLLHLLQLLELLLLLELLNEHLLLGHLLLPLLGLELLQQEEPLLIRPRYGRPQIKASSSGGGAGAIGYGRPSAHCSRHSGPRRPALGCRRCGLLLLLLLLLLLELAELSK
jgi:hypothetical protein